MPMKPTQLRVTAFRSEYADAASDLGKNSPVDALLRSYRRQDLEVGKAMAIANPPPACRKGCNYCCYYRVVARPYEVLAIVDHVRHSFAPTLRGQVVARAEANAAKIRPMTARQQIATNIQCAFLVDGTCSIYPVRPLACRNFHATDVKGCRSTYEHPEDLEGAPNAFVPDARDIAEGMTEGFHGAAHVNDLDTAAYELTTAFVEAMGNPSCMKRFRKGKRVFIEAIRDIGTSIGEQLRNPTLAE